MTARLFFLISLALATATHAASTISFSNITSTNVVKTNDQFLVNSALGGGNYATRTATLDTMAGTAFANLALTLSSLTMGGTNVTGALAGKQALITSATDLTANSLTMGTTNVTGALAGKQATITSSTDITAHSVTLGTTNVVGELASKGNVASTGPSVAGQFPTYSGIDGKSVVPTNGVPLLNVGTLAFTGGAANVVPVFDGSTNLIPSQTTTNELDHVHGVTSAIQTQINAKAPTASPTFTGTAVAPLLQSSDALFGAMQVSRGTLTHAGGNVIVDFASTNRYWSCTITGNVTFVLTNAAAGKWANLFLTNSQATNCTPTFNLPAGSITNWFGGAPSTLTAGTFGSLSYYPISSDTNATKACYVETQ